MKLSPEQTFSQVRAFWDTKKRGGDTHRQEIFVTRSINPYLEEGGAEK